MELASTEKVENRPSIKPFVCSTFQDFTEEREYLSNVVFPKLDEIHKIRGTNFLPVDLYWNKSNYLKQKLTDNRVILLCLDSITRCAPYFICLIGERYGVHLTPTPVHNEEQKELAEWMSINLETAASFGYKWVTDEECRYISLTELEIMEAAFIKKNDHCYFYYRDPGFIVDKLAKASESNRRMILETYGSENDYAKRKLKELKQQIIDTDLPVSTFSTAEELGDLVIRDWLGVLDSLYPPLNKRLIEPDCWEMLEHHLEQESFQEFSRRNIVLTRTFQNVLLALHRYVEGIRTKDDSENKSSLYIPGIVSYQSPENMVASSEEDVLGKSIFLLSGERGFGKTALLSLFISQLKDLQLGIPVVAHHFQHDSNLVSFMKSSTMKLRQHYKQDLTCHWVRETPDTADQFDQICGSFQASLAFGPCIIILDGVDYIRSVLGKSVHELKEMEWLPNTLSPFCKVIISTTASDITGKILRKRVDISLHELSNLKTQSDKREFLLKCVQYNEIKLPESLIRQICSCTLSTNPLFLYIISTELRNFLGNKQVERILETCSNASSIGEVWKDLIASWTSSVGWCLPVSSSTRLPGSSTNKPMPLRSKQNQGWVSDVLVLIAVSKNGLTVEELLESLKILGYVGLFEVLSSDIHMLFAASLQHVIQYRHGLYRLSHSSLQETVEHVLLKGLTYPANDRPVSPYEHSWELKKKIFHVALIDLFTKFLPSRRKAEELPWHLCMVRDFEKLSKALTQVDIFANLALKEDNYSSSADLIEYVNVLEKNGYDINNLFIRMVENASNLLKDEDELEQEESADELSSLISRLARKTDEGLTRIELGCLQYYVGKLLKDIKHYQTAELILLGAHRNIYISAAAIDQDLLCLAQKCLGELYFDTGNLRKSVTWLEKAKKSFEGIIPPIRIQQEYGYYLHGDIMDKLGLAQLKRIVQEKMTENRVSETRQSSTLPDHFEDNEMTKSRSPRLSTPRTPHSQRPESNRFIRSRMDRKLSFPYHIRELFETSERYFEITNAFEGKIRIRHHLGLLCKHEHKFEDAERNFMVAISMFNEWFGDSHPSAADVLEELSSVLPLASQTEINDAEKLCRKALTIKTRAFGRQHLERGRTMCRLATLLKSKRRRDANREATELYQQAIDIFISWLGFDHAETTEARKGMLESQREISGQHIYSNSASPGRTSKKDFSSNSSARRGIKR